MTTTRRKTTGTTTLGDVLPELTLPGLDGGVLDFADLRGRKTLLFFWGSW